jgi:hypothetical protein
MLGSNSNAVKVLQITEKNDDAIKFAIHLLGQELDALQPSIIMENEAVFFSLTDVNFSFRHNYFFDPELNLIAESHLWFKSSPIFRKRLPVHVKKLDGTVAYLSHLFVENYFHWMCQTLSLLRIYQQFCNLDDIDFFYVGDFVFSDNKVFKLSAFHQESLEKAGIPLSKIIQEPCTADRILCVIRNRPPHGQHLSVEDYGFVKGIFLRDSNPASVNHNSHKRIYIERGNVNRRKVVNEDQVIQLLTKYGFVPMGMGDKTVEEQAELVHQAEAIVAPHGAALTNLLFAQPGTKVIELFPYGYAVNYYYLMSHYAGAEYYYLQGKPQNCGDKPFEFDIHIDIQELDVMCRWAFLNVLEEEALMLER